MDKEGNRSGKRELLTGIKFLAAFVLWTILIQFIDVQPAGPKETRIGFAAFNVWFHRMTGVHMAVYTITDWLGLVPIFICMCFGMMGLIQLIRRRSFLKVDTDILLLGIYYVLVILGYLLFEMVPINVKYGLAEYFIGRAAEEGKKLQLTRNMFAYDCPDPIKPSIKADGDIQQCTVSDIDDLAELLDLFHKIDFRN